MKILTNKKYDTKLKQSFQVGFEKAEDFYRRYKRSTLNPVVYSLKELRKNTWDKERIDFMISYLEDYINE